MRCIGSLRMTLEKAEHRRGENKWVKKHVFFVKRLALLQTLVGTVTQVRRMEVCII